MQDADEYSKDYVERDEQRLTELGRRAVEMFAAAHIFAALQEAHSEAESIKRQDALILEVRGGYCHAAALAACAFCCAWLNTVCTSRFAGPTTCFTVPLKASVAWQDGGGEEGVHGGQEH